MGFSFKKCIFIAFSTIVLAVALLLGAIFNTSPTFYEKLPNTEINQDSELKYKLKTEHLKDNQLDVLTKQGTLSMVGWTNSYEAFNFNSTLINPSTTPFFAKYLSTYRYKKWDAYVFTSSNYVGTIAIADTGYLGAIMFHIAELKDTVEGERSQNAPPRLKENPFFFEHIDLFFHPRIQDQCPVTTKSGKKTWELCVNGISKHHFDENFEVKLLRIERLTNGNHIIQFEFSRTGAESLSLKFGLLLYGKDNDSMVTLVPMIEDKSLFYYNTKSYSLKPMGNIEINGATVDPTDFLFAFDGGRGAWPLKSGWVWVTAAGTTANGEVFGFNSGHGFSHPSAKFTEDCFFINGKMHKLFNIKYRKSTSLNDFGFNDWHFGDYDESNVDKKSTCDLEFNVSNVRKNHKRVLIGELVFNVDYGRYWGNCYDEEGNKYEIKRATGLIENKMSLW